MDERRIGRQTPTVSAVLPYTASLGGDAVELYNRSGRTAQPWQELLLEDIMAVNEEGLWLHMKFGWSIPRRNGKSELLIMRSIYAVTHGQRTLYTAHRTTTSHNAWEKVIERLSKAGFKEGEDFKTTKQMGLEHIEWLKGEGVINFRTRSSKGGLGEGYDLLIIDEAQEYTGDQESALKYVVTDSKNPQTLMCGTPPTAVSAGDVFLKLRRDTLRGKNEDAGWAERCENAFEKMSEEEKQVPEDGRLSTRIRAYCRLFRDLFDNIFGEGTSENIFKGIPDNTDAYDEVYYKFLDFIAAQKTAAAAKKDERIAKYRGNRRQKRINKV